MAMIPAAALLAWGTSNAYETASGQGINGGDRAHQAAAQYVSIPMMTLMNIMMAIIVPVTVIDMCLHPDGLDPA